MNETSKYYGLSRGGVAACAAIALIFPAVAGYAAYNIYYGQTPGVQPEGRSFTGATADFSPNDPSGEWHMPARDYGRKARDAARQMSQIRRFLRRRGQTPGVV